MQTFNLSASQLKMRIVNIQGDKMISSLFCYTMEIKMKNKSVNAFYTAEILALVVALIFFAAGYAEGGRICL